MKKTIFLCLICPMLWAQSTVVPSTVKAVTIFHNGAQINRSAVISLPSGKTELHFKGISLEADPKSIQVKSEGRFSILSVYHQPASPEDKTSQTEITELEKRKKLMEEKIQLARIQLLVFKREEEMLLKNQVVSGAETGMKVADLKEAIEYHRLRMQEVLSKKLEVEKTIEKNEDEIKKLNQQHNILSTSADSLLAEIVLTVSAPEAVNKAVILLSYFVKTAGWTPTYDFRINNLREPIDMAYKANIHQYSGEDWKDVKLTLSTANPHKSGTAPVLKKWILGKENDYSEYYNQIETSTPKAINQVIGRVLSKSDKSPIQGATITLAGTSLGIMTDENGHFRLNIPPMPVSQKKVLKVSLIGMKPLEVPVSSTKMEIFLEDDEMNLQEVVVTGYSLNRQLQDKVPGVAISEDNRNRSIPLEITEHEAPTSQSFDILVPYTIPSDGRVYTVEIKEENLPAVFEHYSVPKIDTDVFLRAHLTDWEKYRLLPGEANLFIENTYIGRSALDLSNKDTLSMSFGRDKNIIVSRTRLKAYTKKQFIGSSKSEQFWYEITARNTRSEPINLVIEDQFPVSPGRDVSIDDKEATDAEVNQESGNIKWRFRINPAAQQKTLLKYTIKSPK